MRDRKVAVKYFDPYGSWTWYALEGAPIVDSDNWLFFGLVDGFELELGFFEFEELKSVKLGVSSVGRIEREMYDDGRTLGDYAQNSERLASWLADWERNRTAA